MFSSVLSVRGGSRLRLAAVLSILGLLPAAALHAATGTWIGANGATWDTTAANWSGVTGSPWASSGNNAEFTSAGSATISGPVYASQVNYTAGSGTFTVNGNGLNYVYDSTVSSGGTLELTGNVDSGGGITLFGGGTLKLSGSSVGYGNSDMYLVSGIVDVASSSAVKGNNTIYQGDYGSDSAIKLSGGSTISLGGVFRMAGAGPTSDGALFVNDGTSNTWNGRVSLIGNSTIGVGSNGGQLTVSGVISGDNNLTVKAQGGGTVTLSGNNTYTGTTTVSAGTLQIGSGGATGSLGSGAVSLSAGATLAFNLSGNSTAANTITGGLGGAITLAKTGGGTLTLSGSSSYTGTTAVDAGVLSLTNASALGASGTDSATTVANGAQIALSGNISVSEPITLNGYGAVRGAADGGALRNSSGNNTITGLLSIGATGADNGAWIRGTAGNLTIAGGISTSNRDLTLTGPGGISITTTAMNLGAGGAFVTFDNGTPVSIAVAGNTAGQVVVYYGGKLRTDVANAFSSSTGLYMGSGDNSNGTLDLGGNNQQFGSLQSYGSGSVVITSTAAATLAINQTTNLSYLGQITGAISLAKTGSSTLTLSGNNTYTGNTDISAGALVLGSGGSIANSGVINVASGATFDVSAVSGGFVLGSGQTLKGAGTVSGATTINGNLAPGNSPGTLSFADGLSLGSTSTSTFEIAGIGAGQFDRVIVTGLLNFGGTLALNNTGYTAVYGDSVDLFDWTTTTGSFSSITGTDLGGGLSWDTSSLYSNGVIMVVPEPATWALLAGSLTALLMFRRRRG